MKTKEFEGTAYELNDQLVSNYFGRMTGKIFKVIPIREEGEHPIQPYLASLLRELLGAKDLVTEIDNDERFMQVISILNYLTMNPDIDIKILKSEIFHTLNIVKKMSKAYEDRVRQPMPDNKDTAENAEA